ncbi:type II secretion system F family protein [Desulforamulus aquiferis]|uniref:Type II secretion system F family protein n=1 Tax=Desulforamulus aquiferis TaxID=1397668 RepID=A0AAW7Z8S4_9FIRM|nr:type II secretion system F family protein [Desulforamulus aquiferis]MDO7785802.1 type II secretion system F family protein [Desulforamulus aquiferis]
MDIKLMWLFYTGSVLAFGSWLLFRQRRTREIKAYLQGIPTEDNNQSIYIWDRLIKLFQPLFPNEQGMSWMKQMLIRANLSYTPEQVYATCYAFAAIQGVVVFGFYSGQDISRAGLMALLSAGLTFALPILYVWSKANERREKAGREYLPLLMLMRTLSKTSAGTNIDALGRAAIEDSNGVLASELRYALKAIERGEQKELALMEATNRIGLDDFTRFIESVIEADSKGVALSNVIESLIGAALHNISLLTTKKKGVSDKLMPIPLAGMIMPASTIIMVGPGLIRASQALTF